MDFVTLSGANHESYILSVIIEHHFIVYSNIVFTHVKLSDIFSACNFLFQVFKIC